MGHISDHVPGVEFSTGSRGHGLPGAAGMALAARNAGKSHRIVCLMSDGDCECRSALLQTLETQQPHAEKQEPRISAIDGLE